MRTPFVSSLATAVVLAVGIGTFLHCADSSAPTNNPPTTGDTKVGDPIDTASFLPFDPKDPNATFTASIVVADGAGAHPSTTVSFGGTTYTSDANGVITIPAVPVHNGQGLRLRAAGFMGRSVRLSYSTAGSQPLRIVLNPAGANVSFSASAGGSLATGSVEVRFPANAFTTESGAAFTGNVNVAALGIDPVASVLAFDANGVTFRDGFDPARIPQGFDLAVGSDGKAMMVLPESTFQVDLTDDAGAPLKLSTSARATYRFVLSALTTHVVGDVVRAFRLNEDKMRLEEDGTCTVQARAGGGLECVGETDHFSSWAITTADNNSKPGCAKFKPRLLYNTKFPEKVTIGGAQKAALVNFKFTNVRGQYSGIVADPTRASADSSCIVSALPSARATVEVVTYGIEGGTTYKYVLSYDVDASKEGAQVKANMPLVRGDDLPSTDTTYATEVEGSCFTCPETWIDVDLSKATVVSKVGVDEATPTTEATCSPACSSTQTCIVSTNTCTATVSCSNGTKDGDETDKDCGGVSGCQKCGTGQACGSSADCITPNTCSGGRCVIGGTTGDGGTPGGDGGNPGTGGDGGTGSDGGDGGGGVCMSSDPTIFCGGNCAMRCTPGFRCNTGADCEIGLACTSNGMNLVCTIGGGGPGGMPGMPGVPGVPGGAPGMPGP